MWQWKVWRILPIFNILESSFEVMLVINTLKRCLGKTDVKDAQC